MSPRPYHRKLFRHLSHPQAQTGTAENLLIAAVTVVTDPSIRVLMDNLSPRNSFAAPLVSPTRTLPR